MVRHALWVLLSVAVGAGCGSSKSNRDAAPPSASAVVPSRQSADVPVASKGSATAPPPSADVLNQPANIDVKSCVQHTMGEKHDLAPIEACGECCAKHGFTSGTLEYKGVCTCGRSREPANEKVCATPESLASDAACKACCKHAAYRGHGYARTPSGTSCICEGRTEDKACAGKATSEECTVCCYNTGFFGVKWTAPSTCLCSG